MKKLCPFCLAKHRSFAQKQPAQPGPETPAQPQAEVLGSQDQTTRHETRQEQTPRFVCPGCRSQVPAVYVDEYRQYPPAVFTTVGFHGHGKTVFLAALFRLLWGSDLADYWKDYYGFAVDDHSLDQIVANAAMLKRGTLPNSTRQNFPIPTMLRLGGLPSGRGATLLCYDAAGESFEKATRLVRYAEFTAFADAVLFLISLPDLSTGDRGPAVEMEQLLTVYRNGMAELGGRTARQRLIVVYTKADACEVLRAAPGIDAHLRGNTFDGLADYRGYRRRLRAVSAELRDLTIRRLGGQAFVNNGTANFRGMAFCAVSALGSAPAEHGLDMEIAPRRVLDPLIWVLDPALARRPWHRMLARRPFGA